MFTCIPNTKTTHNFFNLLLLTQFRSSDLSRQSFFPLQACLRLRQYPLSHLNLFSPHEPVLVFFQTISEN